MIPPVNFARVNELVFRGGAPDTEGWNWLYGQGVRTALNLEWEASDSIDLGIQRMRVWDFEPLPWFAPSLEDKHVELALRMIRSAQPGVIYVHCRDGANRTGVVIAAYRLLVLGEGIESVIADFKSFRGFWAWGDERYIRGLPARRAELMGDTV